MLTITHTHEAGTLIEGTARGDGTAEILKQNRWRWGRSISSWFIPQSRDRLPNMTRIHATQKALESAGFTVTVEVSLDIRPTSEVETDKISRQEHRAEALAHKAGRKLAAADTAWARHERDVARLPEGGEPIKIGHHSEGRHRAAVDRAHASMRRGLDAHKEADRAATQAESAAITTAARYNPRTIANRIERLSAEIRKIERDTHSTYWGPGRWIPVDEETRSARERSAAPRLAEMKDQLEYWEQVRSQQVTSGTATNFTADQIKRGDLIKAHGDWRRVVRVNAKTVSVETGYSWTDRVTYSDITHHRPGE